MRSFAILLLLCFFAAVPVAIADVGGGSDIDHATLQPSAPTANGPTAPPLPADQIANPIENPAQAMTDFAKAKKFGWAISLLFVLISALQVLSSLGSRISALAFLSRGRTAVALAGALTVAAATYNAYMLRGETTAAVIAALGAVAAFMWPAPPAATITVKPVG